MTGTSKRRLDQMLVDLGLAKSREEAKRLILAGEVLVDERRDVKPGQLVSEDARIHCSSRNGKYVSRGGEKLEAALDCFEINPKDMICGDFGASTGGFTHCLLERGAAKVYAFDVGYGQMAWSLRQDPRVILRERCNARYLTRTDLPLTLDLIVIDVSFISLNLILPAAAALLKQDGGVVCLVKPQFEVGKGRVGKGGVVRNPNDWADVLNAHKEHAAASGFSVVALTVSPILGPAGNVEFLTHLSLSSPGILEFEEAVKTAIENTPHPNPLPQGGG